MTKHCHRNIDEKGLTNGILSYTQSTQFVVFYHTERIVRYTRSINMRGRHSTFRFLCRPCIIDNISLFFMIIFIFMFFIFFFFLSGSKSFKMMTARWNVCRTNRKWRAMVTHTNTLEKKKHLIKLVIFTCTRLSPLNTPTNVWIIEFVYVQYQVTMSVGITQIDVYLFLNFHIISFLRVFSFNFFFLFFIHREMGSVRALFSTLNALNKKRKSARPKYRCMHTNSQWRRKKTNVKILNNKCTS